MKVVYMGTPDFAVGPLKSIIESGHEVKLVVSQPDKKNSRRGNKIVYSPVKQCALDNEIEVFQPNRVSDDESYEYIKSLKPDVIVVCAYGQIVKSNILNLVKFGCINIHASLLPHLRGAAPIHRSIINGDKVTGVTTMQMNEGLDTGDMLLKEEIEIGDDMTVGELHDKMEIIGSKLIVETLNKLEKGEINPKKQDDNLSTYANKITKEDCHIDFSENVKDIYNKIRGLNPFPLSYVNLDEKNIKIYESIIKNELSNEKCGTILSYNKKDKALLVAAKDGIIGIKELKMQGKKKMDAASFYNGNRDIIGKVFN
ncbi:methionyl-tRNA formyltransferase [Anaerofustis stercorihominis]|uniref:Methionyl-tRNA formyltransferase n=1 Tax=Anaerofustis stercorihominis DSM 17244 TaxID=445971 RepID=B1C5S2_9FIRM|nr:methionyl-tRNA formyltransferase [Anaerofustis stercorihominis]EDS73636.1 methionyl-tRNA formyltransferase [Anaerofustis stercorihominis DSM 17244]